MSKSFDSDKLLVERLNKGDIEAFDKLFMKYAGKINSLARRYLGSKEDAEGLTQEVFIKIWENHKTIRSEYSFRSYIFTITYNSLKKIFRDKHMVYEQYQEFLHDKAVNNTASEISYNEIVKYVDREIDKLTVRQKQIYILSRKKGLSYKEIAKQLNISTKTVENHLNIATKRIRERLEKEGLLYAVFVFLFLQ
jgi:RNA polymerase sigma-70 factor (ECF subfamily)